jgi:hypothetical protein
MNSSLPSRNNVVTAKKYARWQPAAMEEIDVLTGILSREGSGEVLHIGNGTFPKVSAIWGKRNKGEALIAVFSTYQTQIMRKTEVFQTNDDGRYYIINRL